MGNGTCLGGNASIGKRLTRRLPSPFFTKRTGVCTSAPAYTQTCARPAALAHAAAGGGRFWHFARSGNPPGKRRTSTCCISGAHARAPGGFGGLGAGEVQIDRNQCLPATKPRFSGFLPRILPFDQFRRHGDTEEQKTRNSIFLFLPIVITRGALDVGAVSLAGELHAMQSCARQSTGTRKFGI